MFKDKSFKLSYIIAIILVVISFIRFCMMCEFNGVAPYNAFNFYYFMKASAVCFADVVMMISFILILLACTDKFIKEINSGFFIIKIKNNNYKNYLKSSILNMHLKAALFMPIINLSILITGILMFGTEKGDNYNVFLDGAKNQWLYTLILIVYSYVFSCVISNLNLIVNKYVGKTNLNYIITFIVFNFINLITSTIMNINMFYMYIPAPNTTKISLIVYTILYFLTNIIVVYMYKDKEKLVLNYGE